MQKIPTTLKHVAVAGAILTAAPAFAAVVASQDFDGGAVNLVTSTVPTLDGGGGDTFAVGATQGWPTSGGTPFGLVDNTVGNVGASTVFASDNEGVYGVNSNFANNFLGISDTREWVNNETTASWTFNIAGFENLSLSIGMGSMEGSTFTYDAATNITFSYSIDGGSTFNAFVVTADASGDGYTYRALDNGTAIVANVNALLVGGANPVTKILADTGLVATNTFLDKTPATGNGAGVLDTFTTAINGTGATLILTVSANLPNEAAAFDNIVIEGTAIPEPASLSLLALGGLALLRRRA